MAHYVQTRPITWKDDLRAIPFLAPFMLVFAVFILYPLFYSFWISLHGSTIYTDWYDRFGTMEWVGLGNYTRILSDPIFWWSVLLTFAYAILTIFPGIALSLALALALNRKLAGFGLFRSGFFLPNVFDVYVVGVIWLLIYNPTGGLASGTIRWIASFFTGLATNTDPANPPGGLAGFGFWLTELANQGFLNNPWLTLPAIAFAMILKGAGFGMILFLTSLNNINQSVFEAADVDGCNARQKLFYITLPLLRPIILFLSITGLVGTLNAFSEVYAMTDNSGGVSVNLQITDATLQSARISGFHLFKYFEESEYGMAAAISFVMLAIAIVISIINFKLLQPKD